MKKGFRQLVNFLARRRQAGATGTPVVHRCPFPNCGVVFDPLPGRPPVCPAHLKLIDDVNFILLHLRPVEVPRKGPSIVVPRGPIPGGPGPGKAG
jgi:hypothetical protein